MRDETPSETAVIDGVWRMKRHTVCVGCQRYKQTNKEAVCRMCTRKVLGARQHVAEHGPIGDDLSYYDIEETA